MHKIKTNNSIFQNKVKFSPATSFDFIASVKKQKYGNLNNPVPVGVLTFAFHSHQWRFTGQSCLLHH